MKRRLVLAAVLVVASTSWGACERTATAHTTYPTAVTRWRDEARTAGWPTAAWPMLRCVIHHESRGNPQARGDAGTSLGLMQIHTPVWRRWLIRKGIITTTSDLYRPVTNLRAARAIWRVQGWQAWTATRRCR